MQETPNEITSEKLSPRLFRQLERLQSHMQEILQDHETRLARCEKTYEELGRKPKLVADVDKRLNSFWENMPELDTHKAVAASQSTLEQPPASAWEQAPPEIEERSTKLEELSKKEVSFCDGLDDAKHDFMREISPNAIGIGATRSAQSESDEEFFRNVDVCTFNRTIWDASFFINLRSDQTWITIYAAFLLLLNLVLQCMFTFITMWYLAPPDITAQTIASLKKWRMRFGHSFQYVHFGQSLASRLCSGDESLEISGFHQALLGRINSYFPTGYGYWSTGPVLCCIAMFCWSLTAIIEFRKTVLFSIRFWHIPRGDPTEILIGLSSTQPAQLTQLHPQRFVFVQILCLVRCTISILMLGSGLAWLAHTTEISGLVLNAVALEFVFDLDERLYEAACPVGLQRFIGLEIRVPRFSTGHSFSHGSKTPLWQVRIVLTPIVAFCASLACVGLSIPIFLEPVTSRLLDARATLCAGNLDFVMTYTNAHPFWGWSQTLPYPAEGNDPGVIDMRGQWKATSRQDFFPDEIASNLILNLHQLPSVVATLYPNFAGRVGSLQAVTKQDYAEANYFNNRNCQDFKPSDFQGHAWDAMASRFYDRPYLTRPCNDSTWAEYCFWPNDVGDAARLFCPELCGCSTPASAQVLHGCPHSCQWLSNYTTALNEKDCCTDSPKAELIASSIWIEVVNKFNGARLSYEERVAVLIEKAADLLANHGCDGIQLARRTLGLDLCDELTGLPGLVQFRYRCPAACSCEKDFARGCPTLRRKSARILAQVPAIKNHTTPNGLTAEHLSTAPVPIQVTTLSTETSHQAYAESTTIHLDSVAGLRPGMCLMFSDSTNSENKTIVNVTLGRRLLSNHSRRLASGFITINSPLQHTYSQGTTVEVAPCGAAVPTPSAASTPGATPAATAGAPAVLTPLPIPATTLASTPVPTGAPTSDLTPALTHAMTQSPAPVPTIASTSAQFHSTALAAAVSSPVPTFERTTARLWDLTPMPTATPVSAPKMQAATPTMMPAPTAVSTPAPASAPTSTTQTTSATAASTRVPTTMMPASAGASAAPTPAPTATKQAIGTTSR